MKKLNELYNGYPGIIINDIKINSKEVHQNDLFVCIQGVTEDRNKFIDEAIDNGAVALVTNKKINTSIPVIYVPNPNLELAKLCSKFYDYPHEKLDLIGITGTNGKTTVAEIIKDLFGDNCGYLGTNGIKSKAFDEKIRNTTPDATQLFKYLNRFVSVGCKYVSMEASSEAFLHQRLNMIKFKVGVITNITEDHLNVHKTIRNYVNCKKEIIKHISKDGVLILNKDDRYFKEIKKEATCNILSFGKSMADLEIVEIRESINKTKIILKYQNNIYHIDSPLLGLFNVYNLCAAILVLIFLGQKIDDIIPKIKEISPPKGRMEFLKYGQKYHIILDYAHTPDAFKKIYIFLNKVKKGRIITVTGSAGGREHEKRSEMGEIILNNSNYCIWTMDDPRWEDVNDIIDELIGKSNKRNYVRIINREEAIKEALNMAKDDDIILIAGKGDDNYMAIGNEYIEYSDRKVIDDYFKKK